MFSGPCSPARFSGRRGVIDEISDWALPLAERAGVAGLVVACEPTGDRASVPPMLVARAREAEDATKNRADFDATLIARLASERRGHVPSLAEGPSSRLSHRGVHGNQLSCRRAPHARDCVSSGVRLAGTPAGSHETHGVGHAPRRLSVSTDPRVIAAMDEETYRRRPFEGAPPFRCPAVPPRRASGAVGAPGGVTSEVGAAARASPGRSGSEPSRLHDVEVRMIEVHDRGQGGARSRRARTTIDGLSVVGAFAILAERGDPSRVPSRRTSLTHAGRAPRANESGNFRSQTTSGRGRPARRAQRAISGLLPHAVVLSPRRAPAAVGRHSTQRPKARAAPARLRRHDPRRLERRHRLRLEGGGAASGRRRHWRGRGEPDWTVGRTRS